MENNIARTLVNLGKVILCISLIMGIYAFTWKLGSSSYSYYSSYSREIWTPISIVYGSIIIFSGVVSYLLLLGFAELINNSSKQIKLIESLTNNKTDSKISNHNQEVEVEKIDEMEENLEVVE